MISGDTLVFPGQSEEFILQFYDAYALLDSKGVGDAIRYLEESPEKIWVINYPGMEQSASYGDKVITWNPKAAIKTTLGVLKSPAAILDHEAEHARFDLMCRAMAKVGGIYSIYFAILPDALRTTEDAQYERLEERRVITGREQKTALALGLISEGQVTRRDHKGDWYLTSGPTTTNDAVAEQVQDQLLKKRQFERQINSGERRIPAPKPKKSKRSGCVHLDDDFE